MATAKQYNKKFEMEIEMKASVDKTWCGLKEFATVFPKAMTDLYESIQVLEGDGKSAGTTFLSTFKPEMGFGVSTMKERIEFVDEVTRTMSYSLVEGEILKSYKSFKATVSIREKDIISTGTIVKYMVEIEKVDEQSPDPNSLKSLVSKIYQDLDAYLLNHP